MDLLYYDDERKCRGIRWRLPLALPALKRSSYGPLSESVVINSEKFDEDRLEERGLQGLLPPVSTAWVNVGPVFSRPSVQAAHHRRAYSTGLGPAPSMFGMLVMRGRWSPVMEQVVLYPSEDSTYVTNCWLTHRRQTIALAHCTVISSFAKHVDLRYSIPYKDLRQLPEINDRTIARVRQFMVMSDN